MPDTGWPSIITPHHDSLHAHELENPCSGHRQVSALFIAHARACQTHTIPCRLLTYTADGYRVTSQGGKTFALQAYIHSHPMPSIAGNVHELGRACLLFPARMRFILILCVCPLTLRHGFRRHPYSEHVSGFVSSVSVLSVSPSYTRLVSGRTDKPYYI